MFPADGALPFPRPREAPLTNHVAWRKRLICSDQILPCKQRSFPRVLRKEQNIRRCLVHQEKPTPLPRRCCHDDRQAWFQCAVFHCALQMLCAIFFFLTRLKVCGHSASSESLPHFPNSVIFKLMLFLNI